MVRTITDRDEPGCPICQAADLLTNRSGGAPPAQARRTDGLCLEAARDVEVSHERRGGADGQGRAREKLWPTSEVGARVRHCRCSTVPA